MRIAVDLGYGQTKAIREDGRAVVFPSILAASTLLLLRRDDQVGYPPRVSRNVHHGPSCSAQGLS